jgi:hypothetical protein
MDNNNNDERARFDQAVRNLYGLWLLKLDPANVGDAEAFYPNLRAQTNAFIEANPDLSPLCLRLLRANARFEAPLYRAFADVLWSRYLGQRAQPDLKELAAACVHLGWWSDFAGMWMGLDSRAQRELHSACRGQVDLYERMRRVLPQFVRECEALQDMHWEMEDTQVRRDDPDRRQKRWALAAMRLQLPTDATPPYANDHDIYSR